MTLPQGWKSIALDTVLEKVTLPVNVERLREYREIGIRSHGKGIFHKPPAIGETLGDKRVFWVVPDALILNIVFAWEQAVAVTSAREDGMIASHRFPMYRPHDGKCDVNFLLQYFKTRRGKEFLELASPGGAGRNKTLGQREFERLQVVMPDTKEQSKIAKTISTWDSAIDTQRQLMRNSKERKAGLISILLESRTLLHSHRSSWTDVEFGDIAVLSKERFDPKTSAHQQWCIELEHIDQGTGALVGHARTTPASSTKGRFKSNDVLFGKLRPYLGKYWLADREGVCSTEIWILRARQKKCLPEFLSCLVQTETFMRAANASSGSKMPRADWDVIESTAFQIPPIDEQARLANVIRTLDLEITCRTRFVEILERERSALALQLLTGKRRFRFDELTAATVL